MKLNTKWAQVAVVAMASAAAIYAAISAEEEKKEESSVAVKTEALEKHNVADKIDAYGTLSPDVGSADNISLAAPVQIKRMLVSLGQNVRAGEALFEVAMDPAAGAAAQQAETALTLAKGELSRTEALAKDQLATQGQLAAAKKALQDAESNFAAQRLMLGSVKGNVQVAPHAGVITALTAQQGDRLAVGAPIMQIAQPAKLRVLLGVEPNVARKIKVGMHVKLVSLFDADVKVDGKVAQLFGALNPQTRLVDVAVQLAAVPAGFYPGAQVEGAIALSESMQWMVQRSAVLQDDKGSYIYQVEGKKAKRVTVKTGLEDGEDIAITGNFDEHKRVVVSGNYELKDGAALREEAEEDEKGAAKEDAKSESKAGGKADDEADKAKSAKPISPKAAANSKSEK